MKYSVSCIFSSCSPLPVTCNGEAQSLEPRVDSDTLVEDCPRYESHWMSAELMSVAADYIDTLLEDWYPGLGAREGGKTVDSVPYVNRVIPCPYCVNGAALLEVDTAQVKRVGS